MKFYLEASGPDHTGTHFYWCGRFEKASEKYIRQNSVVCLWLLIHQV